MTFRQPHRIWQWLFLIFWMVAAAPAHAGVQEIRVLATGVDHDSHKAADLAYDYARKRAVYLLARKMQIENAEEKCAALTADQLNQIIRGATVLQTKRTGDITYEDVTVTLVEEPLEQALKFTPPVTLDLDAGAAQGVLVVPVLVAKGRPWLWENDNVLMEPTRNQVLKQGRGAVILPAADFDDRRLVDYQNVLQVKPDELAPMFKRYGINEILIAIVTPGDEGTDAPTSILLRRLQPPPKESHTEEITLKPESSGDDSAARIAQAASQIAATATQIAGSTSELEQDKLKTAPSVTISFHYATAHDLAAMEEAVRGSPGVLKLVLPSISLTGMSGTLYFNGATRDVVRNAVMKQGFIVKDNGQDWVISTH